MTEVQECAFRRAQQEQATNKPQGPARILRLRKKLREALLGMVGSVATPAGIMQAARDVCNIFGLKSLRNRLPTRWAAAVSPLRLPPRIRACCTPWCWAPGCIPMP